MAKQCCTNVKELTPLDVANNIKESLPKDLLNGDSLVPWNPDEILSMQWVETLWPYLKTHFKSSLISFHGLPIVPLELKNTWWLGVLSRESKILFDIGETPLLPEVISNVLIEHFDVSIVTNPLDFLDHPQLKSFIFSPSPASVLEVMMHLKPSAAASFFEKQDHALKDEWRRFLNQSASFTPDQISFLKHLPFFRLRKSSSSIEFFSNLLDTRVRIEHEDNDFPPEDIFFPTDLVSCQFSSDSSDLARKCGCQPQTKSEFARSVMEHFENYSDEQKIKIGAWLTGRERFYNWPTQLKSSLRSLKFVPVEDKFSIKLESPSKLFNNCDENLLNLFLYESKFPPKSADVNVLNDLGLLSTPSPADIICSAKLVSSHDKNISLKKSSAVLYWLAKVDLSEKEIEEIKKIPFLLIRKKPGPSYPKSLLWFGERVDFDYCYPSACRPSSMANLVCSAMPVCEGYSFTEHHKKIFDWKTFPQRSVVSHLQNVAKIDKPSVFQVGEMMKEIYVCMQELPETKLHETNLMLTDCPWIWTGTHFCLPQQVIMERSGLDLKPFYFELSHDLKTFKKILELIGAHASVTEEHLIEILGKIQLKTRVALSDQECDRYLKQCIDILQWLADKKSRNENLLVPIHKADHSLELKPISKCFYFDGKLHDGFTVDDDEDDEISYIVHQRVSRSVAENLGMSSATDRQIKADQFGFESFGQHEPLPQRIRNILDEYSDETGIFKELLQNADDALATEVAFVIDWRSNEHLKTGLISEGLTGIQGPALWAYNNSVFQESDWSNLQKLGGQTKKSIVEKIGRFGIGFNAVYHLTDVPSFISGDQIAFLDPYGIHLGTMIKDPMKPGIKFNFVQNKRLSAFKNQFEPYNGLFGCRIIAEGDKSPESLNGTLFRLPIRTKVPQVEHVMSPKTYNYPKMNSLMSTFCSNATSMLLFSQNVEKIKMFIIPPDSTGLVNESMSQVFSVVKEGKRFIRSIDGGFISSKTSMLQQQSNILRLTQSVLKSTKRSTKHQTSSIIIDIHSKKGKNKVETSHWFVTSSVGNGAAMDKALSEDGRDNGLLPCGGIAVKLILTKDGHYCPVKTDGEIFCFLPLGLRSHLPVHVNASFAVASNRRELWRVTSSDPDNWRGKWNQVLLEDPVSRAYVQMLDDISQIMPDSGEEKEVDTWLRAYHGIFPRGNCSQNVTEADHLTKVVYCKLKNEEIEVFPVIRKGQKTIHVDWFPISSSEKILYFGPAAITRLESSSQKHDIPKFIDSVLVDLGFDLVHSTFYDLVGSARSSGVGVVVVSRDDVISFLLRCELRKSLPKSLKDTVIKSEARLRGLLTYCLSEDKITEPGLPLLLTRDDHLREFSNHCKIFSTDFHGLIPARRDLFLHESFRYLLSKSTNFISDLNFLSLVELEQSFTTEMANQTWLDQFWKFMSERTVKDKLEPQKVISTIPHWKVMPAKVGTEKFETELRNAKRVVYLLPKSVKETEFCGYLRKAMCWEVDQKTFELIDFCTKLADFDSLILNVLPHLDFSQLNPNVNEHEKMLAYFNEDIKMLGSSAIATIKSLPLFQTVDKKRISLAGLRSVKVFYGTVAEDGMAVWLDSTYITLLRYNLKLSQIYQALGLPEIGDLDFYSEFVIEHLPKMTDGSLLKHLERLKNLLSYSVENASSKSVVTKLMNSPVIGKLGARRVAREYYNPYIMFFKNMLPPAYLLPKEYYVLLEFCKKIGLQSEVTEELILTLAREIEQQGFEIEKNIERARTIVSHVFNHSQKPCSSKFLATLSEIRFIPSHAISDDLLKLHSPFDNPSGRVKQIRFKGSSTSAHEELLWTSCNILPAWASENRPRNIDINLGIQAEPLIEHVLQHCKNLCLRLEPLKATETTANLNSKELAAKLSKVMTLIYRFLKNRNFSGTELNTVPCILVEEGKKLILPSQLTIQMSDDSLRPYLYQLPIELGEFHVLFCNIGATRTPTLIQLAKVLERLHKNTQGKPLEPNEKKIARSAIRMFFNVLKTNTDGLDKLNSFYLLTHDDALKQSSTLVFNDKPMFQGRFTIENCEDPEKLFLDVSQLEKLPEKLRPGFLSKNVTEKISDASSESCPPTSEECSVKLHFINFLRSRFFKQGMERIVKDHCAKAENVFDEDSFLTRMRRVAAISIECRPRLETVLVQNSKVIPNSCKVKIVFLNENGDLFICHNDARNYDISLVLAKKILNIFENTIDFRIIECMLNLKDPSEIEEKLDELNVPSDVSVHVFEKPGDKIGDMFVALLTQNPSHYFRDGELVGYSSDDGESFVLAKVLRRIEVAGKSEFSFSDRYEVDVGTKDPLVVCSLDLYKFWRKKQKVAANSDEGHFDDGSNMVPKHKQSVASNGDGSHAEEHVEELLHKLSLNEKTDGDKNEPIKEDVEDLPATEEEARIEIRKMLLDAWKLPEKEKKKVIKRLYRRWHPDKNPGKEKLCNEIFKYLLNQLEQLEKTGRLGDDNEEGFRRDSNHDFFRGSWFEEFFRKANDEARFYSFHHQRGYRNKQNFRRTQSNPSEAKRWLKQAQADLGAAGSFSERPQWSCFASQQAAEKSLKAILYFVANRSECSHDLVHLSREIQKFATSTIAANHLENLALFSGQLDRVGSTFSKDLYGRAKCPSTHRSPEIPATFFTARHAQEAIEKARKIFQIAETIVS